MTDHGELRKAEGLLITIHRSRFFALKNPAEGLPLVKKETISIENENGKPFSYSPWIVYVKYRSDIGLTREAIPYSGEEAFL